MAGEREGKRTRETEGAGIVTEEGRERKRDGRESGRGMGRKKIWANVTGKGKGRGQRLCMTNVIRG